MKGDSDDNEKSQSFHLIQPTLSFLELDFFPLRSHTLWRNTNPNHSELVVNVYCFTAVIRK